MELLDYDRLRAGQLAISVFRLRSSWSKCEVESEQETRYPCRKTDEGFLVGTKSSTGEVSNKRDKTQTKCSLLDLRECRIEETLLDRSPVIVSFREKWSEFLDVVSQLASANPDLPISTENDESESEEEEGAGADASRSVRDFIDFSAIQFAILGSTEVLERIMSRPLESLVRFRMLSSRDPFLMCAQCEILSVLQKQISLGETSELLGKFYSPHKRDRSYFHKETRRAITDFARKSLLGVEAGDDGGADATSKSAPSSSRKCKSTSKANSMSSLNAHVDSHERFLNFDNADIDPGVGMLLARVAYGAIGEVYKPSLATLQKMRGLSSKTDRVSLQDLEATRWARGDAWYSTKNSLMMLVFCCDETTVGRIVPPINSTELIQMGGGSGAIEFVRLFKGMRAGALMTS